ncbi:hypothetical protein J437_LFUL005822 [Ladona fulva]|uniref:Protein transport protein Sec24C n=1 Tax=Ladona fulva TaxID=123851 RepID=A0A8K0P4F7_LADFU|nr:hypothetical protein J437_LFUL005822 [Ladona fulva]
MNPQYMPQPSQYGGPEQSFGESGGYPQTNTQLQGMSHSVGNIQSIPSPGVPSPGNMNFQRFPPAGAPAVIQNQMSSLPKASFLYGSAPVSNGPVPATLGPQTDGAPSADAPPPPGGLQMQPPNQAPPPQGSDQLSSRMSAMSIQSSQASDMGFQQMGAPQPGRTSGMMQSNAPPSSNAGPPAVGGFPQGQQPAAMQGPPMPSMPGPPHIPKQNTPMQPPQGYMQGAPPQGPMPFQNPQGPQGMMPGPSQGPIPPQTGPLHPGQRPPSVRGMMPPPQAPFPGPLMPQAPLQGSTPSKSTYQGGYSDPSSQVPMINSQSSMNGGFPMPLNQTYSGAPPPGQQQQQMQGAGQFVNGIPGGPSQPLPNAQYPQNRMVQQQGVMQPPSMPMPGASVPYPSQMGPQMSAGMHPGGQMPPMPGAQPSMGMANRGMQQPQQPARRLDPDHMPSPIQVMLDDQHNHSGNFYTNQKGQVPPLVTTKFITQDQGNASPRFIRATMYSVPATMDMMKQTAVPFGLVISPLARLMEGESSPPIVDMGELGPVRCVRCKAYMCPFMQFIDGGRRFHCNFCKATTEVPPEYFQHLDHTGMRVDRFERPELVLGTYEFVATKDYCRNNVFPKPPAFIFLIDVSYNNIKSGMVHLLCQEMKEILKNLPKEYGAERSSMKVGFITYNNTVHFYNIKGTLAQPQMMVVGDVQDMFMPLLDGFLCDPQESSVVIDHLMEQIPAMFSETRETETVLAPAIQAGLEALKAPGKLKNRDDRKVLGTEKEKNVLAPQTNFYNNLGQECVLAGCSVDLFIFNNSYIDLATIGQADLDGERLIADIKRAVERTVAFDTVMRGVAIEIKHDDKLTEEDGVYVQVALLYTSVTGQRRLRIMNLSFKICTQMADLYRSCDLDTMINFFAKQSVFRLLDSTPKAVKDGLVSRCAQILACYRKNCATPSSSGQLILPECMKLLPLYANCLIKSDALSGGADISIDDRSFVMQAVMIMDVPSSVVYFYPRLIPLHDLSVDPQGAELQQPIRCLAEKMRDDGVYILENGIHMFLWIGLNVGVEWVRDVFGAQSAAQIDIDRTSLPELDNPLSMRVRMTIEEIRRQRHRRMRLTLVRQRDKLEVVFKHFLVEDRGVDGSASYVDFLCHMHKEIRELLR